MSSLSPKESTVRARIPLSDRDFFQRLKYRLADEHIRTGRILEDFGKCFVVCSVSICMFSNQLSC
jgi:hypothetical protein